MKGMSRTLLALIFTVLSLFLLMMTDRYDQARVSELGARFALHSLTSSDPRP